MEIPYGARHERKAMKAELLEKLMVAVRERREAHEAYKDWHDRWKAFLERIKEDPKGDHNSKIGKLQREEVELRTALARCERTILEVAEKMEEES